MDTSQTNQTISSGEGHSCAIYAGGGVQCWGGNGNWQLGNGTTEFDAEWSAIPVYVIGLTSGQKAVAVGREFSCALSAGGGVKCWGGNEYGQLGINTGFARYSTPQNVVGMNSGITSISAGIRHACALNSNGGLSVGDKMIMGN